MEPVERSSYTAFPVEALPKDVILLIFSRLSLSDLCSVRQVSHRWNYLGEECLVINTLTMDSISRLSLADGAHQGLAKIMDLSSTQIKGDELGVILGTFTNLLSLNLGGCYQLKNKAMKHLALCPQLRKLDLSACLKLKSKGFQELSKLTHLEELDLSWNGGVTDDEIEMLIPLKQLSKIRLVWCYRLTNRAINILAELPQLQEVDLAKNPGITRSWKRYALTEESPSHGTQADPKADSSSR